MKDMSALDMQTKITIVSGPKDREGTFGKGIATLLRGIADMGSLNMSAKKIGMAYSKAWRIIKETEAGFGFLLIDRDGARGSTLTPEGVKLLGIYESLDKEVSKFASARFAELVS